MFTTMIITPEMTLQEQANLVSLLNQASLKAWKAVDGIPKSEEYDAKYAFAWELQNVLLCVMDDLLWLGARSPYEDVKMFITRAGIGEP
jgi:hypothetical protein